MSAMNELEVEALTAAKFNAFGDVIELSDAPTVMINRGNCARFSDLAKLSFIEGGQSGISLFQAKPYTLPHTLDLVERHPLGSQAFIPMHTEPFLVVVAPDDHGVPGKPIAFATNGQQAVNYHRNTWHGVLTPVGTNGMFAVVDRIGGLGDNLEEHTLDAPWCIKDSSQLLT